MYKPNEKHLQPLLISNVNALPEKHRVRLEQSWAGVFYRELFCRIKEEAFAELYSKVPSRPNTPVNVLVGLEVLKAGFGWSDEELYDHYVFDVQVRYALGCRDLQEGEFELRTLYNFRQRLSQYNQEKGVNLIEETFEDITDQQIIELKVNTGTQRMDSTQIASNIMGMSRLQLLVEGLQRLWRVLSEENQQEYQERLGKYVKSGSGQYVYRVKGQDAIAKHTLEVGQVIHWLLAKTKAAHENAIAYQVLERLFQDNFNLEQEWVEVKPNEQIGAGCLQSVDDLEATFRRKGSATYKGYVANLSQTCDKENPVQLITKVQVASNNVDDANLLAEAAPDLKDRTDIHTLYVDGAYGSLVTDEVLNEKQIEMIQTGIRGKAPAKDKLSLSEFEFAVTEEGKPLSVICPNGQDVLVEPGRTTGYFARFNPQICTACRLRDCCRAKPGKRDPDFKLRFIQKEVNRARRRRRSEKAHQPGKNPRAAVEAVMRSVKHPFRSGKLPVRGLFRVTCMVIASAAMSNLRCIDRLQQANSRKERSQPSCFIDRFSDFRLSFQLSFVRLSFFSF